MGIGCGLIPAHAGKTGPLGDGRHHGRAHPRSRGENLTARNVSLVRAGSSPLTRGKPRGFGPRARLHRLIPAHAGKTQPMGAASRSPLAHPRSRGENHRRSAPNGIKNGSSPLTRGKRDLRRIKGVAAGLIPAHAGKTATRHTGGRCPWAHPRSRGENPRSCSWAGRGMGSSPLTRGKQPIRRRGERLLGLIPAHAGKTSVLSCLVVAMRAHPRSRGENFGAGDVGARAAGSSPLTRGKLGDLEDVHTRVRLIPAHAGKTRGAWTSGSSAPAHPRSRGENGMDTQGNGAALGSSPLTRGKRRMGHESIQMTGLIPAHAGKTLPDLRFYRADRSDLGKP